MKAKAPFADCQNCPLKDRPFVPDYIPSESSIVFVGEAPGRYEVSKKEPFVGKSGILLAQTVKKAARNADKKPVIGKANVVACNPRNNATPSKKAVACCFLRFKAQLEQLDQLETVIPVGQTAYTAIAQDQGLPVVPKTNDRRGRWFDGKDYQFLTTFHPAFVLRKPSAFYDFSRDIQRAINERVEYACIKEPKIIVPQNRDQLESVFAEVPTGARVVFDIEADGLQWWHTEKRQARRLLQIGLAWKENEAVIIDGSMVYEAYVTPDYDNHKNAYFETESERTDPTGCKAVIQAFFSRTDLEFVAHNGKFDTGFLKSLGLEVRTDFDTMLAHYAVHEIPGTHGLKQLATEYFGMKDYESELVFTYLRSKRDPYSKVPFDFLSLYCGWDCTQTLTLSRVLTQEMIREGVYEMPFKGLLMPAANALESLETKGVFLDVPHLKQWGKRIKTFVKDLENEMDQMVRGFIKRKPPTPESIERGIAAKVYPSTIRKLIAGEVAFNSRSPKIVSFVLYDLFGMPEISTPTVKPRSTSKGAVIELQRRYPKLKQHPFLQALTTHRRAAKIISSYINTLLDSVDVNGRVHPTFLVHGTEIGRLSARNPGIQTIPRPYDDIYGAVIRSAITAPTGRVLIDADYSQAELRVAACLSDDDFLMGVYLNDRDLHSETAIEIYGENFTKEQRTFCKNLNFSDLYGGNEYSFASQAKLPIEEARAIVLKRKKVMRKYTAWKTQNFKTAQDKGRVVSPFGRVRRFPLIIDSNLDEVRKASTHFLVSSVASDLNLLACIDLVARGYEAVLTVHDSIIVECDESEAEAVRAEVQATMIKVASEKFPMLKWGVDADIVQRWASVPYIAQDDPIIERLFAEEMESRKPEKRSDNWTIKRSAYDDSDLSDHPIFDRDNAVQLWDDPFSIR